MFVKSIFLRNLRETSKLVRQRGYFAKSSMRREQIVRRKSSTAPEVMSSKSESNSFVAAADSMLSNHGGKIAFSALVLAIGLIYRWVKNSQNRTAVETEIKEAEPLNPVEVAEVRFSSSISGDEFDSVVQDCYASVGSDSAMNYTDFISMIRKHNLDQYIGLTHLIDRIIFRYLCLNSTSATGVDKYDDVDSVCNKKVIDMNKPIPLHILLAVLEMVVRQPAESSVDKLFSLAKQIEASNAMNSNDNGVQEFDRVSRGAVEGLIEALVLACQVPADRRVVESGVNWPTKLFREKTAAEMVDAAQKHMKPPHLGSTFSAAELRAVLLGPKVCLRGECYRGN